MANYMITACSGINCNDREDCRRFIDGKSRVGGWWYERDQRDQHKRCEIKIGANDGKDDKSDNAD